MLTFADESKDGVQQAERVRGRGHAQPDWGGGGFCLMTVLALLRVVRPETDPSRPGL